MSEPKRVAIVASSWPPTVQGGISTAHYNLMTVLSRRNCTVKAFTFNDSKRAETPEVVRRVENQAVNRVLGACLTVLFRLSCSRGLKYQLRDILAASSARQLNSTLKEFRPDVVIFPDHGAPALYIKRFPGTKSIIISHHNPNRFLENPYLEKHSWLDARLALLLENIALKKTDHVICPSTYMQEQFDQTYEFSGAVSVVPNVVDDRFIQETEPNDVRLELDLPADARVVYIPAAGSRIKGSEFVPDIVQRIAAGSNCQAGFFLSGDIEDELRHYLAALAPSVKIFMPGKLPYAQNLAYLKSCSICVSPCLMESFGMALVEAIACGVPVVAFDVGGNQDIVNAGVSGCLVPIADTKCLIESSLGLLSSEVLSTLSGSAVDYFQHRFHPDLIADRYLEIFERLN